jgi:tryptophan-rich sensory protein
MKKFNLKIFVICFIIVFGTAFIGSLFTSDAVNSPWYDSVKPSITPPNYVFPIVWNILFFLITLSLYFAWIGSKNKKQKKKVAWVFGINLALNMIWSLLYFKLKNPLFAFYEIIFLFASILVMIFVCWRIDKKSAYLLMPYLLWAGFASVLNYLSLV